jgi:hypothetical protein
MALYTLIVSARPIPGGDEAWHRWYDMVHLPEVLSLDGFVSASRYRVVGNAAIGHEWLAIYGIDAGGDAEAEATVERLKAAPLTPCETMDLNSITFSLYANRAEGAI